MQNLRYGQNGVVTMSVVANNNLNFVLFQQAFKSLPVEAKNKEPQEGATKQPASDFADLSASAKTKLYRDNSLKDLSSLINTETSEIAAQKAILTEKQNILEFQTIPDSLNSVKNHIVNTKSKAIFQAANQPKENILTLIT